MVEKSGLTKIAIRYESSLIPKELATLDPTHKFLVGQLLLLVVDHRKLVGLQLVLLEFDGLTHQICQLDDISALGVVFDGLAADSAELVDGLVVDLSEQLFGAEGLVAYFFDAFEVLGDLAFQLAQVGLYLLDELVEEHLHDSEVVLELLHDLVPDIIVDEQLVLILGEGLAVDLALLEPDVALVGDHALPLRQHQDEDLGLVEGDRQLVKGKAVVDLQGQMVQENCFVPFEQKPVLYLADDLLLVLCLLVFLSDRFVDILLLRLVGVAGLHDRYLLLLGDVGHLHLLDDLLVLEIDSIHLGAHLELILG